MEQPREPQSPVGPAVYPPPYVTQQYTQAYVAPPPRPSAFTMFGRFLRLLLRRFIYGLVLLLRPLRPVAGFVVVILALLGVIGWMSVQIWAPKPNQPPEIVRADAIPPSPAVESYLNGRRTFNGDLMWDAHTSTYQAERLQEGASKATFQVLAAQEKRMGVQYKNLQYIGGVKLEDGGSMYYYSVDVAVQNQQFRVPIVFLADSEGKIDLVFTLLDQLFQ